MSRNLVIVFVKNSIPGKVKTRLAKTIGNYGAIEVYKALVDITEKSTSKINASVQIYYSEEIELSRWTSHHKLIQHGKDLGERMCNAFTQGFENGFERIVLIGSDLPDLSSEIIQNGLKALNQSEVVFGPAEDGGYYLVGMSQLMPNVFENKPWSKSNLLETTLKELDHKGVSYSILEPLNDIDTFDDLKSSDFYKNNSELQDKITQIQ